MNQIMTRHALIITFLIWAGVCIGANMIAAPAKFHVADLTLPVALQVGRVQFQWIRYFEVIMASLALLFVLAAPPRVKRLLGIAIAIFVVQGAVILPLLSARTDLVITGQYTGGSYMHIYFIICEFIKIITLISGAIFAMPVKTESVRHADT